MILYVKGYTYRPSLASVYTVCMPDMNPNRFREKHQNQKNAIISFSSLTFLLSKSVHISAESQRDILKRQKHEFSKKRNRFYEKHQIQKNDIIYFSSMMFF